MEKPKLTKELLAAVKAVCNAEAYLATVRPVIEGYQKEILEKHQFKLDKERWQGYGFDLEKPITELKDTYKMSDKDFKIYLKECELKHKEHGFKVKKGYCPLLIAERLYSDAQYELKIASIYIHKLTANDICRMTLEQHDKLFDLIMKLAFSLMSADELAEIKKPL